MASVDKTIPKKKKSTSKRAEPQQPQPRYHGVSLCKGRYRAVVWFEGKNVSLGTSATPEEAARKHDVMVIKLFSPTDERLNFPPSDYSSKLKVVQALSTAELQSRLRSQLPLEGPVPEFRLNGAYILGLHMRLALVLLLLFLFSSAL